MTVQLSTRAQRDIRALRRSNRRALDQVEDAINSLDRGLHNLDVIRLQGRDLWMRLRKGDWRILFRRITPDEHPDGGYLVARVVNRSELEEAVRAL